MSTPKRTRTPIKTEDRLNYAMLFSGKVRTFPKVVISFSPFDNRECISVAEIKRLNHIVQAEVLASELPLLIGEVHSLLSLYDLSKTDKEWLINKIIAHIDYKVWRYEWDQELPRSLSLEIKNYFKSLTLD